MIVCESTMASTSGIASNTSTTVFETSEALRNVPEADVHFWPHLSMLATDNPGLIAACAGMIIVQPSLGEQNWS